MSARNVITVQAPAQKAREALPDELTIGSATLEIWSQRTAEGAFWGRDARRFRARWTKGRSRGEGFVEIRPASRGSSELVVGLDSPDGFWTKITSSIDGLRRMSFQFARGLRYQIETRTAEQASPFSARRTTAALVKERSA